MSTNTNPSTPSRDVYREACFKDAYGIPAKITVTNFLDSNGNWEMCIVSFNYKGLTFGLIEHFKGGADNSTDFVILEKEGKEEGNFKRFVDAELKMVELMRSL
jgi:hypothetical protein